MVMRSDHHHHEQQQQQHTWRNPTDEASSSGDIHETPPPLQSHPSLATTTVTTAGPSVTTTAPENHNVVDDDTNHHNNMVAPLPCNYATVNETASMADVWLSGTDPTVTTTNLYYYYNLGGGYSTAEEEADARLAIALYEQELRELCGSVFVVPKTHLVENLTHTLFYAAGCCCCCCISFSHLCTEVDHCFSLVQQLWWACCQGGLCLVSQRIYSGCCLQCLDQTDHLQPIQCQTQLLQQLWEWLPIQRSSVGTKSSSFYGTLCNHYLLDDS
jgi:hypothetical protein